MGDFLFKRGLRHWSARESPGAHVHVPLLLGHWLLTTLGFVPDSSRLSVTSPDVSRLSAASFLMFQCLWLLDAGTF